MRDIVLREVPAVLQGGLYALPALFSSLVVVIGYETNHISLLWYSLAGLACLVLRLIGIFFDVNLPKAS